MDLSKLRPARGAKHKRKRIGRGNASGQGTYAGKGLKGQQARSGKTMPYPGFEGGQWPLVRKIARRGFTNPNKVYYEEVKVSDLARFNADSEVGPDQFVAAGIVKRPKRPVKILSNGEITRALIVRAHKFTAAARQKIEAAGGRAEQIGAPVEGETESGKAPRARSAVVEPAAGVGSVEAAPAELAEAPAPSARAPRTRPAKETAEPSPAEEETEEQRS